MHVFNGFCHVSNRMCANGMCEQAQCTVDVIGISHDFVTLCAMSKHYPLLYKLKEYKKQLFHYDLDITNTI